MGNVLDLTTPCDSWRAKLKQLGFTYISTTNSGVSIDGYQTMSELWMPVGKNTLDVGCDVKYETDDEREKEIFPTFKFTNSKNGAAKTIDIIDLMKLDGFKTKEN